MADAVDVEAPVRRLTGVTILVVEDQPALRKLISITLGREGAEVREAVNVDQALELFRSHPVKAAIVDVGLPGPRDGIDACAAMRTLPGGRDARIIIVSARGQRSDLERGRAAGADDYVLKPFSPRALVERTISALAERRAATAP